MASADTPKRNPIQHILSVIPKLHATYGKKAVNASATIPAIIGTDLPDHVFGIVVYFEDDNQYHINNGTASATSAVRQQFDREPISGCKDELDLYQIYTGDAADNNVSISVYTL